MESRYVALCADINKDGTPCRHVAKKAGRCTRHYRARVEKIRNEYRINLLREQKRELQMVRLQLNSEQEQSAKKVEELEKTRAELEHERARSQQIREESKSIKECIKDCIKDVHTDIGNISSYIHKASGAIQTVILDVYRYINSKERKPVKEIAMKCTDDRIDVYMNNTGIARKKQIEQARRTLL